MVKRTEILSEKIEDSYLGIKSPTLDLFKIKLTQNTIITKKITTQEEVSRVNEYSLYIDRKNISKAYHDELSKNLKDLFGMKWAPFDWATQTFNYYTSKYTGDEEFKKNQLIQIFDYIKTFEEEYKLKQADSYNNFNEDKKSYQYYKDEEIIVKYHPELDSMIVLAINFLGPEKYKILAGASKEKSKFGESVVAHDFFDELYNGRNKEKKFCFIINPYDYQKVKELIEKKKEEKADFLEIQERTIQEKKDSFISYQEKNIFDFKVMFNENKKCFEFYCKGYKEPQSDFWGNVSSRSIIARWALNFILSEEVLDKTIKLKKDTIEDTVENTTEEKEEKNYLESYEIDRPDYYKINLNIQKEVDTKERKFIVPATDWKNINKIYEKFLVVNEFFTRIEKSIKIENIDFLSRGSNGVNLHSYPSIYLDEKGKAFFIYGYRTFSPRTLYEKDGITIKKEKDFYINMKGVPITLEEVNEFFTTHLYAEIIKNNSIFLNSEIWMTGNQNTLLNSEERLVAFENIYMHAKLANEEKKEKKVKKNKL